MSERQGPGRAPLSEAAKSPQLQPGGRGWAWSLEQEQALGGLPQLQALAWGLPGGTGQPGTPEHSTGARQEF